MKRILGISMVLAILTLLLCACGTPKSIVQNGEFVKTNSEILTQMQGDLKSVASEKYFDGEECEVKAESKKSAGTTCFTYSSGNETMSFDNVTVNITADGDDKDEIPDNLYVCFAGNESNTDIDAGSDNFFMTAGVLLKQIYPQKEIGDCINLAIELMKDATSAGGTLDKMMENDIPCSAMAVKIDTAIGLGYMYMISITPSEN